MSTDPVIGMPSGITLFKFWCQYVLPAVFDDTLSYYEAVAKMVGKLNEVIKQSNIQTDAIKELQEFVIKLQEQLDEFKEHGFDDYYKQQVQQWIAANLKWIFQNLIAQVYFGLTDDGYFCAYIPASWSKVQFDTIVNYDDPNYGHLVIKY